MKILILGASGGLGTQLVKTFSTDKPLSWDKKEADFFNLEDLFIKLEIAKPNIIINAVAYNAVDKCETDLDELTIATKLNVDLPKFLANWCLTSGATLIHYSTDYVFSGTKDKFEFSETATPNPINKYGETKYLGEKAVMAVAENGLKYYLIRLSKLFGPKGSSPHTKASFFDVMLQLSESKSELTVVDEELSCFTYTPDLAKATRQLLSENFPFGVYHLTNSGPSTWYESILELKKILNLPIKITAIKSANLSREALRPKFSVLKNTKFPALRDYREALRDYLIINR